MAQQNSIPPSKKVTGPDKIPGLNTDPSKKPKFNMYWLWGAVFIGLILWNVFRTVSTTGIEVKQIYLTQLLKAGDVVDDYKGDKEKTGLIVVRNRDVARMFLNKDSVKNKPGFYKTFLSEQDYAMLLKSPSPQVFFNIPKEDRKSTRLNSSHVD